MAKLLQKILLSTLMVLASSAATGRSVVTNATDLLACQGFDGVADVEFSLDATVVWGTKPSCKDFLAKTADGYIKLTVRDVFRDEIDHLYQHIIVSADEQLFGLAVKNDGEPIDRLTNLIGALGPRRWPPFPVRSCT